MDDHFDIGRVFEIGKFDITRLTCTCINMFARFDENPAMTLQDIKETKRYGRTHARTDNVKTVYPPQTKFAGGIKSLRGV